MKLTANPAWLSLSPHGGNGSGAKLLRIMKLTTIIILAACLHTSAKGVAQQTITFSGKEVSLESVFTAIKKQTTYRFFFNTDMLTNASKVTIDVKNAQIEQVMNMALKDQPLTFTIKGRTIFIMKKPEEEKKSVQLAPTGDPITVSGRVTDENGEPLAGANVKVKGGNNGVTTDAQGRFTLNGVDPNASLEVSFVGRETQLLAVKGKSVFSVALGQRQSILDETVVVAYGTTTKRYNTGNVGTIKAKEIEMQPVNNPLLALQGRVPGLFITQANGIPGGGVKVRIQGQNSIGNGNDPLYIIDGVPYVSQMLSTTTGGSGILGNSAGPSGSGQGNPLSYINPSDIESIEVLKDADATAIYGSRAANGALLITTKKGRAGITKVDINLQYGWGEVRGRADVMNTDQYLSMRREAKFNDNSPINATDYDLNGTWDTTKNTDWQEELIGKTARYTNVTASVSGGTASLQYLISGAYRRETTVFPGSFANQKGSLHFNINSVSENKKFRVQLSGSYLADNNPLPYVDLTTTAIQMAPNAPALFNEDGTLNWAPNSLGATTWPSSTHPISNLLRSYENKTKNLISNAILSYQIFPGFEIKSSYGYTHLQTNEFVSFPLVAYSPELRASAGRGAVYSQSVINSWIIEPHVNYEHKIGKGKFNALLGATIQQRNSEGMNLSGNDYNSDAVLKDIRSATSVTVNGSTILVYKYNALFGRLNYNWQDKYIVNITARRDGSSRFGKENQFHNFGAIGAAWIFSEERIVKKSLSFLSFGKLRGSYGTTGNDQIPDYAFINLYNPITADVGYQGVFGLGPNGLSNPYLQWEKTQKVQIGVDFGFLKDRVFITANYVNNRSSNQLLSYALPIITGNDGIVKNFPATIQNTGLEFTLNTSNIQNKSFKWSSSINVTIPKNKLIAFPNLASSTYANDLLVGQPIGISKVYRFLGVEPATGRYQFLDKNGNSTVTPNSSTDRTVLINSLPKFYGGVQNSFSYKGCQVDILLQFVKQIGLNSYYFGATALPGNRFVNQPVSVLDRWKKAGDIAAIQKYSANSSLFLNYVRVKGSDAAYDDASYLRLKNISVSYQLPKQWQKLGGMQNLRIYAQCQNLITFTSYDGMDPETGHGGLPPLRMITVGIQAGL